MARTGTKARQSATADADSAPVATLPVTGLTELGSEKRDLILLTAAQCFSEFGFEATSLDEIASRVKLHKATLYHYVESKQDILYQCLTRSFQDFDAALAYTADKSIPVLDRLRYFFGSLINAQNTVYGRCLASVGAQGLGHEPGSRIRAFRRRLDYAIRALLEEGIADGKIRPCRVPMISAMIFGAFNWVSTWYRPGKSLTLQQICDAFLDIAINGLGSDRERWLDPDLQLGIDPGGLLPTLPSATARDKRSLILEAAAQCFAEQGYEATSLNHIADKVGLHKATLYHYVSSKGDLLYQCLERSFSDLDDVVAYAARTELDPLDRFAYFFRHLILAQNSHFGRCQSLISPQHLAGEPSRHVQAFKVRLDTISRTLLSEAMQNGELRKLHPVLASAFMFGASNWVPHWRRPDRDPAFDEVADTFLRIFLGGIRAR